MGFLKPGALGIFLVLSACASAPPGEIADPYEPMNRQVHAFNKGLDARVVRPITQMAGKNDSETAVAAPPKGAGPVELIGNFGSNLALPSKVVNHLLQGRPEPAVRNTFRFLVNTTLGFGGFLDPATADFALPEIDTDFGETLHVWGVPSGAYLELPVLGPSTERDFAGKVIDILLINPLDNNLTTEQKIAGYSARLISKAGDRARFGSTVDSVLHESADSYAQTRLLYTQHRRYELKEEGDVIDPYAD